MDPFGSSRHPSPASRSGPTARTALALGAVALGAVLVLVFVLAQVRSADARPSHPEALPAPAQRLAGDFAAPVLQVPAGSTDPASAPRNTSTDAPGPAIPGLGPETMARIPAETTQVLVASTPDADGTEARTALWEFADGTWERTGEFAGHNGGAGWLEDRREGDRTSPIGVFTLTDAGGALPDPGAKLPYTHDPSLRTNAQATYGDDWADVFDFVIAIDYNRVPGSPPTDDRRPLGWDAGGKIWLHVDHDSPTKGCISMSADDMRTLLRTLDPAAAPHIVMGPEEVIAR
ncbi:L,D-transpeptidase family protein [Brevibacterium samyangense]|uniref:L,D-transpeptidase family protein n=1 Tax=Brevibacterium samyangense TaxID=366888 RepID=UPI0031D256D7